MTCQSSKLIAYILNYFTVGLTNLNELTTASVYVRQPIKGWEEVGSVSFTLHCT